MRHDTVKKWGVYLHAVFNLFVDSYVIGVTLRPLYSRRTDKVCSLVGGWAGL